jgi:hypothetical protein
VVSAIPDKGQLQRDAVVVKRRDMMTSIRERIPAQLLERPLDEGDGVMVRCSKRVKSRGAVQEAFCQAVLAEMNAYFARNPGIGRIDLRELAGLTYLYMTRSELLRALDDLQGDGEVVVTGSASGVFVDLPRLYHVSLGVSASTTHD